MNEENVVYIYIYSAILLSLKILSFTTIRMNLESVMLSKISQREKDNYSMVSLTC